ncbi:MAG: sigma-70 family RNA polymerase sigma factor [Deltaproteobacteria bacterium]|nr:MAG: sigma-70 family RNA polymerase sigma factor [Deltaproteobacteria bacterium]
MTRAEREAATATALVDAARAGDRGAFAALVARYRKRIFALALHITRSASEADDITQDVFLKAYRALSEFEGRSQFFTWVYRMTVNRSLNVRRDRARRGEDMLDDPRLELAVAVDSRSDPGRAAELRQNYARLLRALDGLPADMRTTVILVCLQGMAHGEVAIVQKVSEGTIAWRMHEARRRLHDAMQPEKLQRRRELSADLTTALAEYGLVVPAVTKGRA